MSAIIEEMLTIIPRPLWGDVVYEGEGEEGGEEGREREVEEGGGGVCA